MSASKLNAAPKAILHGIKDEGGSALPVVPEQLPTHLPHVFLYTSEGPEIEMVAGANALTTFGSDVFELRSKFTTHQTVFANVFNKNANSMVIQRIKPTDANPEATLTLSVEVIKDTLKVWERDLNGNVVYDMNGEPQQDGTNTTVGHKLRWIVAPATDAPPYQYGERASYAGTLTGSYEGDDGLGGTVTTTTESVVYPILDFKVSSFGAHGNLKGIRLSAPTTKSSNPADETTIEENKAFIYRIQMVKRTDERSSARTVTTLKGEQFLDFTLKADTVTATGTFLGIEDVLLDAYRDLNASPKQYGNFNDLVVYTDNIEQISKEIFELEQPNHPTWTNIDVEDGAYLINILTGKDVENRNYHTMEVIGRAQDGVEFTSESTHFAAGGSDGTMSYALFDEAVRDICLDYPYLDMAYWPQSALWDSGFSEATKKAMGSVMGKRKDIVVFGATQDVMEPQYTPLNDSSAAQGLGNAFRMFPESELFGTPACRGFICGQSGKLLNSQYKGLLPLNLELAEMVSRFMGAGNGVWRHDGGFDEAPANQLSMFDVSTVNGTYKTPGTYADDWDNGLVWAQTFNRKRLFFPQFQSVYTDSTSPVNSMINVLGLVEAEKVCYRSWQLLTGNGKLTPEQFLERSDSLLEDMLSENRFDNRFRIKVKTYFTGFDEAAGYSWSADITMYQNNMRTVGSYTVISNRMSNFA